jgi:glycosyltransferase involved in cell wall biosynthesis
MANPSLREKFGRAGRKRAEEKFSWSAIARQTKALYQSVVG